MSVFPSQYDVVQFGGTFAIDTEISSGRSPSEASTCNVSSIGFSAIIMPEMTIAGVSSWKAYRYYIWRFMLHHSSASLVVFELLLQLLTGVVVWSENFIMIILHQE